jgi:HEAT repeat protein
VLHDEDASFRIKAALALSQIDKKQAPDAARALMIAFDDKEVSIQTEASGALCELGPDAKYAVAALGKVFLLAGQPKSHFAAQTLGEIGKAAVPALAEGLACKRPDVRWDAMVALGRIGADAKEAATSVSALLREKDPAFRTEAARTLGRMGPGAKEAVLALARALTDESYTVRLSAADALGDIGPNAKDAVPALTTALKDKSDEVSEAAAEALAKIKGKGD